MGERKGTNHYYPPDYDPRKGGLNKFLGTHALRERARKIGMGILIIRFEMPFNIWCNGCGNHIGMGVRYNAEKKKIGEYITTPIWNFKMKCHLCPNYIEIKTEPKTSEYIVVSGARRQDNRWDPKENEQVVPEDKNTSKRLYDDAMFKLEHGYGDKKQADGVQPALAKLTAKRQKLWQDDYAANCALRQQFREKSKELKARDAKDAVLLKKSSLQIKLLPESKEDSIKAALLCQSASKHIQEKKTPNKQKVFGHTSSLSCFDKCSKGPNMDKEMAENNLSKLIILGAVRNKSLDNKDSQCEGTSDDKDVGTFPSKMDKGNATSDEILSTTVCSRTYSENSELGRRNVNDGDCSLNILSDVGSKVSNSDLISTLHSPDKHSIKLKTARSISLVSHDYNSSSSDESIS